MKKLHITCLITVVILSITYIFFLDNEAKAKYDSGSDESKGVIALENYIDADIQTDEDITNKFFKSKSGQVVSVPWENNINFINAQEKQKAIELMAAYKTVLKDPLPGEEENVHLAARMLCGIIIEPGQTFSQNLAIGPYTQEKGYQKGPTYVGSKLTTTIGGGVCKIASTIYNVAILSNMQIVERHNHTMPVPYVPYGQDATVSYGNRDIRIKNSYSFPILIWAEGVDNILHMGFYGREKPPKVVWQHETISVEKAQKVFKTNLALASGTEQVTLEGMDGAVIKSWLLIENSEGAIVRKELGLSRYTPMNYLIEQNP